MLVEAMRASGCFTLEPPTTNTEYKEADYLVVGALTDVSFKYTTGGYDDTSTVANKVLRMSPQSASMALDLRLVSVNIAQTIFHKNYSAGLSTPPGLPFRPSENNERLGFSSRESVVQGTDLESVSSEVVTQAVNGLVAALKKTRVSALRKAR
jgi:curli biogenesis system outer membrane secretion channel CsgG